MNKKNLIIILALFSICVIVAVFLYYDSLNRHEDPRIVPARKLVDKFEKKKQGGTDQELLSILDQISPYYLKTKGYEDSYELGVFENDRAAVYINSALYKTKGTVERHHKLRQGRKHIEQAISIYLKWKSSFGRLDKADLKTFVTSWMVGEEFIEARVEQLVEAQMEIDRRLSVAYTNYGIIQRHLGEVNGAVKSYTLAIELWSENQSAENNLRILMGKKPRKPSFIRKLFPPKRLKKN